MSPKVRERLAPRRLNPLYNSVSVPLSQRNADLNPDEFWDLKH